MVLGLLASFFSSFKVLRFFEGGGDGVGLEEGGRSTIKININIKIDGYERYASLQGGEEGEVAWIMDYYRLWSFNQSYV